jgi:O-methyltransferase involved in polyketide biosynthesis
MVNPNLQGIARTLFVPLTCRALESVRPDAILHDPQAVELFHAFGSNRSLLMGMSNHDQFFVAMRARQFDRFARSYLDRNPGGLVVDIGCGLDTRFDRLDNGQMTWLGLDLPDVIELRHRYLPDTERCQTLACSMFDLTWLDAVAQMNKPVIFLAEGVFSYFTEAEVKVVITALAVCFPGAELVFEAYSSLTVNIHKRTSALLKETGTRAFWAVDDPHQLEAWGLRLLDKWGYFDQREPRLGVFNLLRYTPLVANANYVLRYGLERKR